MFYPYEGYRSVTPVDAARVNRTIFANFHRSDVLSVSSWSYFDCSSILPVFYLMTSHNQARSIIFCPSSDQKIPGRKLIASAKYQTGTIGNDVVRLISIMLLFVVFYAPFLMNAYAEKILLCSLLSSFSVIMLALMLLFG